mmetsp:Transcript_5290/g.8591  ORF Transcript_5290/g.8591 Transcript_5290/m.8591 type:complete len:282 (+) Transcript_5290:200-1045(+)
MAAAPVPSWLAISPALEEHIPLLAICATVQVLAFVPCLLWVKRQWPEHKDPCSLADTLISLLIFPALAVSAIAGAWSLRSDVESRWHGIAGASSFHMTLYMTRSLIHCFMQPFQDMTPMHLALMTLHHILSMLSYGCGMVTGRCHFWACFNGCCEMSTIFLNNHYLSKQITIGGKELKAVMPNWVTALNGLFIWMAFLVFRLMLFPTWLYLWYSDVMSAPERTWEVSNTVERYVYAPVTLFLLVISTYWFVPVTKGLLKALGCSCKSACCRKKGKTSCKTD